MADKTINELLDTFKNNPGPIVEGTPDDQKYQKVIKALASIEKSVDILKKTVDTSKDNIKSDIEDESIRKRFINSVIGTVYRHNNAIGKQVKELEKLR